MEVQNIERALPKDFRDAVLLGRVWRPLPVDGPCVVIVRQGQVFDVSARVSTVSELLDMENAATFAAQVQGECLGPVQDLLVSALECCATDSAPMLLAPCDLQPVKACGVTFAVSLLERVIEELSNGDAGRAQEVRASVLEGIGAGLADIKPGSEAAGKLKAELIARNAWSQYLEVGIGPDAEVFTKAVPMSAVGFGAGVGLHPASSWNNPEPEVVLAVNSRGEVMGAALGNDVNLRDIEGRSALLLGKAKDNNASCAIGPFIRLFDQHFTMDTIRQEKVSLMIEGKEDGFSLSGTSDMRSISRDPLELVRQVWGDHHQYPDGFMLFLGTMFSPIQDRDSAGGGFTHRLGDVVTISSPCLGALINQVQLSTELPKWTFGVRALYENLHARGLMSGPAS